jgi:hypothetical protein
MTDVSSKNSIKNIKRYRIRTLTCLIKSRDIGRPSHQLLIIEHNRYIKLYMHGYKLAEFEWVDLSSNSTSENDQQSRASSLRLALSSSLLKLAHKLKQMQ